MRGTVCHTVFELLLNKKHKKHFDLILEKGDTRASKPVMVLVEKHLVKLGAFNEENFNMCMDMIRVGLDNGFYGTGEETESPSSELEFLLESKNPKYKIRGYIDKFFKYKDKAKIVDYKSSKYKFKGEELTANIQAMAYTLACQKKIFPDVKDVEVEFVFLRFPKQPLQQIKIPLQQLRGFEYYLAHVYDLVNKFNFEMAKTNFASDNMATRWLCKAGKTWKCPYYDPVEYYALRDEEGETIKTSFKKEDLLSKRKENEKIVKLKYEGCPAHISQGGKTSSGGDGFLD